MYVRSVPCDGGMITEQSGAGVGPDQVRLRSVPSGPSGRSSALPCRNGDADLWFAEAPAELEEAKSRCGGCPLRQACLEGALERAEPWGVWGGEIFDHGRVIPRKRPRGRPRKADLERDRALALAASR